jgi:hypothetical protein
MIRDTVHDTGNSQFNVSLVHLGLYERIGSIGPREMSRFLVNDSFADIVDHGSHGPALCEELVLGGEFVDRCHVRMV